jgi:hypothetical protein
MNPIPSVLAFLLCDRTIEESVTRKKTVVGIFDRVNVHALPVAFAFGIYARLIDAEGEYNFLLRLSRTDGEGNEHVVATVHTTGTVASRLMPIDIAVNLPPIIFDSFGRYEVQLHGDDVYLGHASLDVIRVEE